MTTALYQPDLASNQQALLSAIRGQKLIKLVRHSFRPAEEVVSEFNEAPEDVFSLTIGPLFMYFESGLVLGFNEDIPLNSIVLWVEANEAGQKMPLPSLGEGEFFEPYYPIEATDPVYAKAFWHRLPGQRVKDLKPLCRKAPDVLYEDLPNEIGLLVTFESGVQFVLSRGLYLGMTDFYVIQKSEVDPEIISELIGWDDAT